MYPGFLSEHCSHRVSEHCRLVLLEDEWDGTLQFCSDIYEDSKLADGHSSRRRRYLVCRLLCLHASAKVAFRVHLPYK